ncbi:MAG: hypothetical protein VB876_12215 [Pirellulales bacterium]
MNAPIDCWLHSHRGIVVARATILCCGPLLLFGDCAEEVKSNAFGKEQAKPTQPVAGTAAPATNAPPEEPPADAGNKKSSVKSADELLREFVLNEMIEVTSAQLDSPALKQISGVRFSQMTLKIKESKNGYSISKYPFAFDGTNWTRLEKSGGDRKMPVFKSLLSSTFRLKGQGHAETLEAALDALFPLDEEDEENKSIQQDALVWTFVRDKFFDDKSGFIFTTDQDGVITDVAYSLRIKK